MVSPIHKLDEYLLWEIFTLLTTLDATKPDDLMPESVSSYSPLTRIRHCSQVCSFWRNIVMKSAPLWASSIDLNVLGQEKDDWRHEVLRRTKNAPLTITGRCLDPGNVPGSRNFFLVLLTAHWEQIQVIDVTIHASNVPEDEEIVFMAALVYPAPKLRVFSIKSISTSQFILPSSYSLFAGDAPSLIHFSIGDKTMYFTHGSQIVPALSTAALRYLTLDELTKLTTNDLLTVLASTPLLEYLSVNMVLLSPADQDYPLPQSLAQISVPRLQSIDIKTQSLAIFATFLDHIFPHPGCLLHIISVQRHPVAEEIPANHAEGIYRVITRYGSDLLAYNATLPCCTNLLSVWLMDKMLMFKIEFESDSFDIPQTFKIIMSRRNGVSKSVLEPFADAVSSIRYPKSVTNFQIFLFPPSPLHVPSLLRLYLALDSITQLQTSPKDLAHIVAQQPEDVVLFPLLSTVVIGQCDYEEDAPSLLRTFLQSRKDTVPVKTLILTPPYGTLSSLQVFDDFAGLSVLWSGEDKTMLPVEYACRGGSHS